MCRVSARRLSIYNFVWRLLKATKKTYLIPQIKEYLVIQKCKETKNCRSYPTEFAGSTQNLKKIIRTPNLPIRTNIFPKKTMYSTLKKKRSQKFVWELLDEICRLNPKSLKNHRNTKSTNQNEHFSKKKLCYVTQKCKL
jgi:hypothetical protein